MVNVVMVPLDGSEFGEQALPIAAHVATDMHADIELVHVVEALPPYLTQGAPVLDPTLDAALRKERQRYLEQLAEQLRGRMPLKVTTTVLGGPVGDTLAARIEERRAALVVAATHGRGGLSRAWLGSVASSLVRHSSAPVLLFRPAEPGEVPAARYPFERLLLPLDGSATGEEAVDHALRISGDRRIDYVLLHVVTPPLLPVEPAGLPPPDTTRILDAAQAYLDGVAGRIRPRARSVETRVLEHAHAASAILESASENSVDLVAMETHGRSGLSRLLMGSVADKVVRSARLPVLLHRPRQEEH